MAKFINIPTAVTGQSNLLFNGDNVLTVVPPTLGLATGEGLLCTVCTHNKLFKLTFSGTTGAIQNANAIAGAAKIQSAILGTYSGPTQFNVVIDLGTISIITIA